MRRTLNIVTNILIDLELYLGVLALMVLLLFMVASIVSRYFFNYAINFALELSMATMILIVFLPLAAALRDGEHPGMSLLTTRMPLRHRNIAAITRLVVGIVTFSLLCYVQFKMVSHSASLSLAFDSMEWLPYSVVEGCMFAGTLLTTGLLIIYLGKSIRRFVSGNYSEDLTGVL